MKIFDKLYNWFMERYIWFKYRNKPYIEYYRALMEYRTPRDPQAAVGGNWERIGQLQFDRLKKFGMKPHHKLFDIGCGTLRGGRHSIKYLEPGNYTGNDISESILMEAKKVIENENLTDKKARLLLTKDIEFNEVSSEKFDFINAQSVLSHMPPEDIKELFSNIKKIMHKETIFLATFFLSETGNVYSSVTHKNFLYPLEWMQKTAAENGLHVELADPESKQKLMKITIAT